MAIDMSQFYQVFFDESAEHLAEMESLLLELDIGNPDSEQLNAIFRAAHSIKGSAGTFGFTDLAEVTHILENLLDRIRKHELELRSDMVDAFLEAGDMLKDMLAAHQGQAQVEESRIRAICQRLQQLSSDTLAPAAATPEAAVVAQPVPEQEPEASGQRWLELTFVPTLAAQSGDGLSNFLADLRSCGELEILASPSERDAAPYYKLRLHTAVAESELADQLDFLADGGSWKIQACGAADDPEGAFGFFAPAETEGEDEAYGFFEPVTAPEAEPEAYGFFEALPVVAVSEATEDEAYGFFEPLPETPAPVTAAVAETASASQEEAYGFFEPLPEPVAPPAAVVNAAPVVVEEGEGYGFFVPVTPPVERKPVIAPTSLPKAESVATPSVAKPVETAAETRQPESKAAAPRESRNVPANKPAAGTDSSIRVSVEKVDQLINLVGELVITQAMLLQTATQMEEGVSERLLTGLAQLERNTRDLQESVMSIRMMPISFVFSRFPRVVRDLSSKLGKQVELKTSGETTELDKGLIERITDPLTHLIRNSLDHGIELPEARVAAGKNPVGTITLKAYHQGGNIVIEVGDDGAGLPRQKILAKAREKGMQVSDQMSDQEVFALIFEAGFSTAEQVTDVSGRGVGMDVVRRNIQALGGRIEIESMLGVGTRMTVRLPLTLAILDGMSIAVGDQTYIVPLSYVIESLQPTAGDIKTLSNQARVIQVRGEYLPVIVLHELFNMKSKATDFEQGIMIVLDADGSKAALFVDALVGQHQVVIKSLEANYRRVSGISGATIMGDGHVALILDISAIASLARAAVQRAQ
jgi:two-component system chemotaxis sensor kinase CheA